MRPPPISVLLKRGKNTVTHLIRVLVFHLKALVFPTTEMQRGRNERLLVSVPLSAGACALLAFLCVCVFSSARKWWWHVGVTGCPITQAYFTSLPSRQLNSTLVKLWGWTRRGSGKMRRSGVEFGRMDRQTAHQLCPGSLKSLYWNGNVGQKKHQPATAAAAGLLPVTSQRRISLSLLQLFRWRWS